jgi:hypothetical protein
VVTVIVVGVVTWIVAPGVPPKLTRFAPVRLVPVIVTLVPPAAGPLVGENEITVGFVTKVNAVARVDDPPDVVTVTGTLPGAWALVTAVIFVPPVATEKVFAVVDPNVTEMAPVKLVPVIVTVVVPAAGPEDGATEATSGFVTKVNAPALPPVPPVPVSVTATGASAWAGVLTVTFVGPVTCTVVPGAPPNVTALAPVRLVPVTVTGVPPATGPFDGVTEVMVGVAT